jgi:hypothetical protein
MNPSTTEIYKEIHGQQSFKSLKMQNQLLALLSVSTRGKQDTTFLLEYINTVLFN